MTSRKNPLPTRSRPQSRRLAGPLLAVALLSSMLAPAVFAAEPAPSEELILFVRSGADSAVADALAAEHRPALEEMAEELGVAFEVVDVAERGAPAEVHVTPLLVYQSPRGRAFFQGRYVDTGKAAHFVRTQRVVPPAPGGYEAKDAAVLELGRAKIMAPLKITGLAGDVPEGHDPERFAREARQAVLDGFARFEHRGAATLGPSDRSFYMDFHPYRSSDGRFFLSTAIFSQFNCIEPVFTSFEEPVSGRWDTWRESFGRAARLLEDELDKILATSKLGDGFDPVPADVAAAEWQALGLELPERRPGQASVEVDVELPTAWELDEPVRDGAPRLVFRFPSPLDRYSGEVGEISGRLELPSSPDLAGASGFVEAETGTVTMGEKALDNAIHTKMISVERFPSSRFELEKVSSEEPLAFGRISRMVASGSFTMMGVSIPLEVRAQLEPIIGEDGEPRLHVQAGFELRLEKPFGVAGPDGPAPANDTLQFNLDALMSPASGDEPAANL